MFQASLSRRKMTNIMKNFILTIVCVGLMICSGCKDEKIIDSKPGKPIEPVTNLNYTIADGAVQLSWKLPSDYPDDVIQPVSVQITATIDGKNEGNTVIEAAPETYVYSPYVPGVTHKFTVKVMASVDTTEPYESDLRLSLGNTVNITP